MGAFRKTKGAISIFLVIILVPMMTVSALFVDAGKVYLGEAVAESAGDLALNTALTDYDAVLKDLYGLFATSQNTEELYAKLGDYYRTCIISANVSAEDADSYVDQIMAQLGLAAESGDTSDILQMELIDFDIRKRTDATLANAAVLEKQIVDFMKYRAPIHTGLSFLSSLQSFATLSKQTELVDRRMEYYEEQESVMESARKAWKEINEYNKSGFIRSDSYFAEMESGFAGYEAAYQDMARKIIMDLYDTQNYGSFAACDYLIEGTQVEVNGLPEVVLFFYTDGGKTSRLPASHELTVYSEASRATAEQVRNALQEYDTAYQAVEEARGKLLGFDNNTYGPQYLVQTNRHGLYTAWVSSAVNLYEKYRMLKHTAAFAGDGVMDAQEQMCGENSPRPYSYYYGTFAGGFESFAARFNGELSEYNSLLRGYAAATDTGTGATEARIAGLYNEIAAYRKTVNDAKACLERAVPHLEKVLDGVRVGGGLEQKEVAWESLARDSELKNTSMSKQDLAEIDSLSTYLNEEDVRTLTDRLNRIIPCLEKLLRQIDSYQFFGTRIGEISDYTTLVHLLESRIGADALRAVPTDRTELENRIQSWCSGQFTIGEQVDVSWTDQSGTQANLIKDKPNFYSYLYTHFNEGEVSTETTEKTENQENGENLYNNIKSKSAQNASSNASVSDASAGNEINGKSGLPSEKGGGGGTASASVATGDNAVKDTGKSLGSMLSGLSSAVKRMGTDLRDKLYVSDYILGMFSYDTIERELEEEHPGEGLKPETITLEPISKETNFAYGAEVEYIIYGGNNASNLGKAYGSIYGIRLGFNLIYAFTNAEIRDGAFAMATPISAATLGVLPVPLIQGAIIIGIACCESALDLSALKEGKSVPLFKNEKTWRLSFTGLLQYAKGEVGEIAKNVGTGAIDEGAKKLTELLDMTDEQLNEGIDAKTAELEKTLESTYDTMIARHANTAIQKLTTLSTNAVEEHAGNPDVDMAGYVSEGLDRWLAEEAAGVDTSSDLGYLAKAEAVSLIKQHYIGSVLEEIQQIHKDYATAVSGSLNQLLDKIRDSISAKLGEAGSAVKAYKTKMIDEAKASVQGGADQLKTTLNEKLDGIFGTGGGGGAADNTGMASLLSFSYSDYLRLFLMIGLYTNEEGVLLRTADVIQVNMGKRTGKGDYRLSESAVYVEASATVQVKPVLLALPLFSDVERNPVENTNWYTIQYKNVKGY
ncbi:MAG: hypothetical protein HFI63_05445 [Lachnospiraceae bacterium]|nr:hypothetical protein [Lachnospiraceae bacterium]